MFELLLVLTVVVAFAAMLIAWDASRDLLHPLIFMAPMFVFLYGWMPWQLWRSGDLANFFDDSHLIFVQTINLLGVASFAAGCLLAGTRLPARAVSSFRRRLPAERVRRLAAGGAITGALGLAAWLTLIMKSGGPMQAFSKAYSGGWDDSGYVRDGSILLLSGILLVLAAMALDRLKPSYFLLLAAFALPWLLQAIMTSRRGPTFALFAVLSMGWYLNRNRRPPLLAAGAAGLAVGWLILFLVANRQSIYVGSDKEFTSEVTALVEAPNTGNEFIYGSGSLLSAIRRDKYFWGMRYLAQIVVRPVPTAIWPTKYEDFGVPELLHNAGTGEGIGDTMGWNGAPGSAPGIVADLWIEGSWLAFPALFLGGWAYGKCWRKAVMQGGVWASQYAVLSALSIYLVMQTMEAVIFRLLLLSIPLWVVWAWTSWGIGSEVPEDILEAEYEDDSGVVTHG